MVLLCIAKRLRKNKFFVKHFFFFLIERKKVFLFLTLNLACGLCNIHLYQQGVLPFLGELNIVYWNLGG